MNSAGTLPTDAEYQAAIQNPASCFLDPELRSGKVELSPLQLPRPRSGNFATVYKIIGPQAQWAVRCFTRSIHQDQRERYDAIAKHLEASRLRYTTGFQYLDQGIRVGRTWVPIVKMEWVHGETLTTFVERRLGSPRSLLHLAHSWAEMVAELRAAAVAHGDLQHGNVLVVNEQLRLVDYDGMFVPALAGRVSHETGHRNYQHPARTGDFFNLEVDNFSAWVVFVSLVALAAQPSLWQVHRGGDDCLLFRNGDFTDPGKSALLRDIRALGDPGARAVGALFEGFVLLPPEQIPPLDTGLLRQASKPAPSGSRSSPLPEWVTQGLEPTNAAPATAAGVEVGCVDWVFDMLEAEKPTEALLRGVATERLVTAALLLLAGAVAVLSGGNALATITAAGLAVAASAGIIAWRYYCRPERARYRTVREQLRGLTEVTSRLDDETKKLLVARGDVNAELSKATQSAGEARRAADEEKVRALAQPRGALVAEMSAAQNARAAVATRLRAEEQRIGVGLGGRVAAVTQELAGLRAAERAELQRELVTMQERCVRDRMKGSRVLTAGIRDVGQALRERLEANGIHSAWDATYQSVIHVYGFGPRRASAVADWRTKVEAYARRQAPSALEPAAKQAIEAKYNARERQLKSELEQLGPALARELAIVRARAKQDQEACDAKHADALRKLSEYERAVEQRVKSQCDAISDALRKQTEEYTSKLSTIDDQLRSLRDERFSAEWRRQQSLREVERMKSFAWWGAYALRVVCPL